MANPEHFALLKQSVEAWNEWRQANLRIGPDLSATNLSWLDLSLANLAGANLTGADLSLANLAGADLRGADLRSAYLRGAHLRGADLRSADLRGAHLRGTDLEEADLEGAHLPPSTPKAAPSMPLPEAAPSMPFPEDLELPSAKPAPPPLLESVLLGASAPSNVQPEEEFTVHFVAYLQGFEDQVDKILKRLSSRSKSYLGIGQCRWQEGVKVTVILSCQYLDIAEPQKEFEWHSPYQIIPFDVSTQKTASEITVVLKLDVYIEGVRVASLRLDLHIRNNKFMVLIRNLFKFLLMFNRIYFDKRVYQKITVIPATTAFASYASQDRLRVLDRIDALKIGAGIDVFQDCLSLNPGESWKKKLLQEILNSDLFLLFWSKFARDSQWVKWEWTTVLEKRGEEVIQLHPLDTVEEAPPPPELAHLHFGSPVMCIRKSYEATTKTIIS